MKSLILWASLTLSFVGGVASGASLVLLLIGSLLCGSLGTLRGSVVFRSDISLLSC